MTSVIVMSRPCASYANRRRAPEGIGHRGDLQGIILELVRDPGHLPERIGDGDHAQLRVIGQPDGIPRGIDNLRQEEATPDASRAIWLGENFLRAIRQPPLIAGVVQAVLRRADQFGLALIMDAARPGSVAPKDIPLLPTTPQIHRGIAEQPIKSRDVREEVEGPLGSQIGKRENGVAGTPRVDYR